MHRNDKMPNGTDTNDVVPLLAALAHAPMAVLVEALAQLGGNALMICTGANPTCGQAHARGLPQVLQKSF